MEMRTKNICPVCRNVNELTATQCRYCSVPLAPLPSPALPVVSTWWRRPSAVGTAAFVVLLAICSVTAMIGRGMAGPSESAEEIVSAAREGDVAQGQAIFNRGCNTYHSTTQEIKVGPGLAGLFGPDGPTLPTGVDYGGNLPNGQPITVENVKGWIRSGGQGQIGAMPPNGNVPNLTDDELADLIAYLITLNK